MKNAAIQLTFDEEKLSALKSYMAKKEVDLESELGALLNKLYEKHVPAAVREYIDSRPPAAPQRPSPPRKKVPDEFTAPENSGS